MVMMRSGRGAVGEASESDSDTEAVHLMVIWRIDLG
jgi:hypothetical protein